MLSDVYLYQGKHFSKILLQQPHLAHGISIVFMESRNNKKNKEKTIFDFKTNYKTRRQSNTKESSQTSACMIIVANAITTASWSFGRISKLHQLLCFATYVKLIIDFSKTNCKAPTILFKRITMQLHQFNHSWNQCIKIQMTLAFNFQMISYWPIKCQLKQYQT